ncbi:MAG: PmoA family protein [Promethearchaeota archaeon]
MNEELSFVVLSGSRTRNCCPVSTVVETKAAFSGNLWLVDDDTGVLHPGYAHRLDGERLEVFVVLNGPLTRQGELELVLSGDQPGAGEASKYLLPMKLERPDDNTIRIEKNGGLFANFHYNDAVRPYLMPLVGPFGDPVTREYPLKTREGGSTDHVHHRSLWTAWGDVNGADNWSEGFTGVPQVVREVTVADAGYALAHVQADISWMDRDGEEPNLEERRDLFVYNTLGAETILDVRVKFTASHGDVRFGDTKEGGFVAVRVADPIRGSQGGRIENALGMSMEVECWGKRAAWCDYSGIVNGHAVGVAIMDHPDNHGYPTYWHVRDYGLMAANPLAVHDFKHDDSLDGSLTLPAGESLEFRYRVFVHAGDARDAGLGDRYLDFVNPPEMKHLQF